MAKDDDSIINLFGPQGPRWRRHWDRFELEFKLALTNRLQKGFEEYGDGSFSRDPSVLLDELAEEALDVCGWGFILWVRLRDLHANVQQIYAEWDEDERLELEDADDEDPEPPEAA